MLARTPCCDALAAWFAVVALLWSSPALADEPAAPRRTPRPNVLMIAIDDLNDWVEPLGGHPQVRTPHLVRLAERGVTFTNAHCQAPLCNPSRTSLLTGLRPSTTGVYGLAPWFRDVEELRDVVTLPQHFTANGYHTRAAGKIFHGGYPPPAQREREFLEWGPPAEVGATPAQKLVTTPGGNHPLVDWGTFPHRDEDKGDWRIATWAVEQLESDLPEPFFLAAGFFLPHVPCYATPPWFELYPVETLQLPPVLDGDRDDTPDFSWYLHWKLPEVRLSWLQREHQWEPLVRSYLASTSFVDSQVGRVLNALEATGRADSTIVVLWSDHGWHLGEKGITGKNSLWERSTRVPLIFAGPGIAHGAQSHEAVELLDIYPTLVELCGLPPPEIPESLHARTTTLEGASLAALLRDSTVQRSTPAITTHNPGNHSVRTRDWRFIHYADGSSELYHLPDDPHEWHNLATLPEHQELIRSLSQHLPRSDRAPVPGSAHRVLVHDGDRWLWEGEPIRPADRIE